MAVLLAKGTNLGLLQNKWIKTYWWVWLAIVVVIVIGGGLGIYTWIAYKSHHQKVLSFAFFQAISTQDTNAKKNLLKKIASSPGETYPAFADILLAREAIKSGNSPLASTYFKQASNKLPPTNDLKIYAHVLSIYTNTTVSVENRIKSMLPIIQPNKPLYGVLSFYLASLYLQNGNNKQARQVLSSISETPGIEKNSQTGFISKQLALSIGAFSQ